MKIRANARQKLIAASAAACLILAGAGWGFWRVTRAVWRSDFVLGETQSKIDGLADERRQARALEMILESRKEDLTRIAEFFADRERPIAFIESVERAAAASGNKIAIDAEEGAGDPEALRFRITAEGTEAGLLRYVRLLEALSYKLEMEEITYQKTQSDPFAVGGPKPSARLLVALRVRAR